MLLVANWAIQNDAKDLEKCLKPWHMGTHLIVLSESYLLNTNTTGFGWFSKILHPCALNETSRSIVWVKSMKHPADTGQVDE